MRTRMQHRTPIRTSDQKNPPNTLLTSIFLVGKQHHVLHLGQDPARTTAVFVPPLRARLKHQHPFPSAHLADVDDFCGAFAEGVHAQQFESAGVKDELEEAISPSQHLPLR